MLFRSILEKFRKAGKRVGLVTDTRITHATPAAFAAHVTHRSREDLIAENLLAVAPDVMLGGGVSYWIPSGYGGRRTEVLMGALGQRLQDFTRLRSRRRDDRNLLAEAEKKGYCLALSRDEMLRCSGAKMLGLFTPYHMPGALSGARSHSGEKQRLPTLKEMAQTALKKLSERDEGFFLMVEAGLIDDAAHDNDAGTLLHELLNFDDVLSYLLEWTRGRNDTLLVLISDHDTASFGFSYSIFDVPSPEKIGNGLADNGSYRPGFNFGKFDILDKLYRQKKSYRAIMREYNRLPEEDRGPGSLMKLINDNMEFKITRKEAARILEMTRNEYYRSDHRFLKEYTIPRIDDFREFYVYTGSMRPNLIGRTLARQQNVTWGSGTHSASPVLAVLYGPGSENFRGLLHSTDVGRCVIKAAGLK